MKKLLLFLLIIPLLSYSQDESWVEIVTDDVGLDARGFRVWVADVNGDEYPDLLWGGDVGATLNHIHLYLNTQDPNSSDPSDRVFVDASQSSGIQVSRNPENENRIADVAALGDVDNDGDLDLVTSIYTHRLQNYGNNDPGDRTELLLNDGNGNFTLFENSGLNTLEFDTGIEPGMTNVAAICFLDYNRDGNLDIYFGTWFTNYVGSSADRFMPNVLVRGNGDGTFEKVGAVGASEPLYGATVFDWNNDGWVDIATSSYCRTSSRLFMNMEGEFVDATELSNYNTQRLGGDNGQNLCQWEAIQGDFDNDGDLDLLEVKVHGGYLPGEGRTTVTVNGGDENDYILNWELNRINRNASPNAHVGDMGGVWMDWDNDGDLDMMIGQDGYLQGSPAGGVRLFFLTQDENGIFNDITHQLGILPEMEESHSMEPADFDLDGDLDLFVASSHIETYIEDGEEKTRKYKRIELLENKIGNTKHWVAIKPKLDAGMVYNGTRIELYQADKIMTREIHQGGGHFGYQSPEIQYFGLGENARIDSIKIKFNGDTDEILILDKLSANNAYSIGTESSEIIPMNFGNGAGAVLDVAGGLDFGTIPVGLSELKSLTITNSGDETLNISSAEIEDNPNFKISGEFSDLVIDPGESANIQIEFTPDARLDFSQNLTFISNSNNTLDDGSYSIELYGSGFEEQPIAAVSEEQIEFDPTFVDSLDQRILVIENLGEVDLNVTDVVIDDIENFTIDSFILEFVIAPGEQIELPVNFTPQSLGEYSAEITVLSDGYLTNELKVNLFGICDGPLPEPKLLGFGFINFGNVEIGESAMQSIQIENSGNGVFQINEFVADKTNSPFEFKVEAYPVDINAKETKTIDIEFKPTEETSESVKIILDANVNNTIEFLLRGNGIIASLETLSDGSKLEIKLNPNPVNSNTISTINLIGRANLFADFYVVDINGKVILNSLSNNLIKGDNNLNINFGELTSGVYFLVAQTALGNIQTEFVVE